MTRSERLGVLGGSFDPIHNGHLSIGKSAAEAFSLSRVLVMPAAVSPFKTQGVKPASAVDRANMVKLAIADDPLFEYCDVELARGGVSFAIDSVRTLRRIHPDAELFFIIGMDSLQSLCKWKDADELVRVCSFATLVRPGCKTPDANTLGFPKEIADELLANVAEGTPVDVSSTQIRELVRSGKSIDDLVPETVAEYIRKHHLYL